MRALSILIIVGVITRGCHCLPARGVSADGTLPNELDTIKVQMDMRDRQETLEIEIGQLKKELKELRDAVSVQQLSYDVTANDVTSNDVTAHNIRKRCKYLSN